MSPQQVSGIRPEHRRDALAAYERYTGARESARREFRATVKRLVRDGATQAAIARAIGVSRQRLWQILNED